MQMTPDLWHALVGGLLIGGEEEKDYR